MEICTPARRRLRSSRATEPSFPSVDRTRVISSVDETTLITRRHPKACSASALAALAHQVLARCDRAASYTEEPGKITRTFLSEPMRRLHEEVAGWMSAAGMSVQLDAAGNLIGRCEGTKPALPVLVIGSHLDTVPDAGKYDGALGVLLGVAAVQALGGRRLPFGIDLIAFSEEEGVRY